MTQQRIEFGHTVHVRQQGREVRVIFVAETWAKARELRAGLADMIRRGEFVIRLVPVEPGVAPRATFDD